MAVCACITDITHTNEHKGGVKVGGRGDNLIMCCALVGGMGGSGHPYLPFIIPISWSSFIGGYNLCACTYIYIAGGVLCVYECETA